MKYLLLFVILIISQNCFCQVDLSNGLIAYYPFNGNAKNVVSDNFHGTLNGSIQLTKDRFGVDNSAYLFDGLNSNIVVEDNGALARPAYSICYYFKTNQSREQVLVGRIGYQTGIAASFNSGIFHEDGKSYFGTMKPLGDCSAGVPPTYAYTIQSPPIVQLNEWNCLVNTFENGKERIYLNGALVKEENVPFLNATQCSTTDLIIGSWWKNDPLWFSGVIDDVRIYDRAITSEEVTALCSSTQGCNFWLGTPTKTSAVDIGVLNIPGNQMTIEATILQTKNNPVFNTGDIVSKHTDPSDNNYLLRPGYCSITTSNGFFQTPDICKIEDNKIYHIAMVYDGTSLKFYRNGYLMSQVAASGNLYQNSYHTRIGYYAYEYWNTQFFGFINEVRIWNVARSQSEIRSNMNTSLPNPTTQPGLQAYYTFDNLINKQGNASWNGTLVGGAAINQSPPTCDFVADSCGTVKIDSIIVNDYTEVTNYISCTNELIVGDGSKYNPGDTVVIMQMKGATIDSTNTANSGKIINYNNAGNYEFNIIKLKSGNSLTLLNILKRNYDFSNGKVQLIRVPYFENMDTSAVLTCLPWDGAKGGVLVLNVKNQLNLKANIDVSGRGFRHGLPMHNTLVTMNEPGYSYDKNSNKGAEKGEGISNLSSEKNYGRGAAGNGGGGGNAHNSGGGGGGNGGKGGDGGDQWETGKTITENVGGKGGHPLTYSSSLDNLFMGGAGGMGQANDDAEYPSGNGGGVVIINVDALASNNFEIKSNGSHAEEAPNPISCKDGMGGGGAGGTVLLNIAALSDNLSIEATGGNGANHIAQNVLHGPGGGGGGGVIMVSQSNTSNYTFNVTGGKNGVNVYHNNNPYGATPGNQGLVLSSYKGNFDLGVPFVPGPQTIDFTDTIKGCTMLDVEGPSNSGSSKIINWQWDMGDGFTNLGQYFVHDYKKYGTFNVTLTTKDENGCVATGSKTIEIKLFTVPPVRDTFLCKNDSIQLNIVGGYKYRWIPDTGLSDPNISNPMASPQSTIRYVIAVGNEAGCITATGFDVVVNELPSITITGDASVCDFDSAQLSASGAATYVWTGSGYISDSNISNPLVYSASQASYTVNGTDVNGCSDSASFNVSHFPKPTIDITGDTSACENNSIQLSVSGGNSYVWSPSSTLTNSNSSAPIASPVNNTTYYVEITDQYNCKYFDSVAISTFEPPVFSMTPDTSICLNESASLRASGGDDYTWGHDNIIDQMGDSLFVSKPGVTTDFWVLVHHKACNLSDTLRATINVRQLPNVSASSSNDIDCLKSSSQLSASGGTSYIWTPSDGLSGTNTPNPMASPTATTQYTVTATGTNGCIGYDTVSVKVNYSGKVFSGLPNAFTPNGDGVNDCVSLKSWAPVSNLDFRIYNRFGQLIFQTNKMKDCWDGTFRGQPQDADVYVYIIKAQSACGDINQKGTITLIR